MGKVLDRISKFYQKYENLGLKITFFLISLQVIHLYWLASDVVMQKLVGHNFFILPQVPVPLLVAIDYLEIPALFSGIVFYLVMLHRRDRHPLKNVLFLSLLAVQVLHMFWITDEVVYGALFNVVPIALPIWLVWIAILIDYLELPVIFDLFRKIVKK